MDVCERVECRPEHFPRFCGGESPLRKDLRQILVRALHDGVKKLDAAQLAATGLEKADQVGMRKILGEFPSRKLQFRVLRSLQDEFDRGLPGLSGIIVG